MSVGSRLGNFSLEMDLVLEVANSDHGSAARGIRGKAHVGGKDEWVPFTQGTIPRKFKSLKRHNV
jgi:hypothetical protein